MNNLLLNIISPPLALLRNIFNPKQTAQETQQTFNNVGINTTAQSGVFSTTPFNSGVIITLIGVGVLLYLLKK